MLLCNVYSVNFVNTSSLPLAISFMLNLFCVQVEIVMGLEEEFGISVEEDSAQSIATVQDAADLIEDLISKKA